MSRRKKKPAPRKTPNEVQVYDGMPMDERLIKSPMLESGKAREIIGFGSGVGNHGEDNYTVSTEQFSFTDIHSRLRSSIQQLYAPGAGWSVDECEAVVKGILNVAPELSGLSLVRATGVGDEYIRDFMRV